jgi:hypothetical protein
MAQGGQEAEIGDDTDVKVIQHKQKEMAIVQHSGEIEKG